MNSLCIFYHEHFSHLLTDTDSMSFLFVDFFPLCNRTSVEVNASGDHFHQPSLVFLV